MCATIAVAIYVAVLALTAITATTTPSTGGTDVNLNNSSKTGCQTWNSRSRGKWSDAMDTCRCRDKTEYFRSCVLVPTNIQSKTRSAMSVPSGR
mmetsp:Transcript_8442/g.23746  ORF Transcript_8442/g.23746 Transcript_8442/m.23746 type:complete len:94 (-) Transcript_8442:946-1227(-)